MELLVVSEDESAPVSWACTLFGPRRYRSLACVGRTTCLFLIAVCAGALVQGCVHYQPLPLHAEKNLTRLEGRSLTDIELRVFLEANGIGGEWPRKSWGLRSLTLAALYFSPELDLARTHWRTIQAGQRTAGQRPNPTLSLVPQYDTTISIPSPWIVASSIDVPIEMAGRRGYRMTRAKRLSEAAGLDVASEAWRVRTRLRGALVDLYAAVERERLLVDRQVVLEEGLRLLTGQIRAGAVSPAEVARGGIALDTARLDAQGARGRLAEVRVVLTETIGLTAHALDGVFISFDGLDSRLPDLDAAVARRQALLGRADILAALARYAASEASLRLEIVRQYPNVHLGPGYEFDQGDNKWGVGLTIELPVLNHNQGPIAEAEARRAESAASFDALQARVSAGIDRGIAVYRSAMRESATARELLVHLGEQERRLRGRFEAGDITRAELLDGKMALASARLARVDALAGAQRSLGRLEEALQSPVSLPTDGGLFMRTPKRAEAAAQP